MSLMYSISTISRYYTIPKEYSPSGYNLQQVDITLHSPKDTFRLLFKLMYAAHTHPNCYQTDAEKKGKIATPTATDFIIYNQ